MRHELDDVRQHDELKTLGRRLRAELPALVDETESRLLGEQEPLVRRIDPAVLRGAIAITHERFLDLLDGAPETGEPPHVALGAAIAEMGIPVEMALAGYRAGAQVGWRHVERLVTELGVSAQAVLALAAASLAYMDELAANSLEGFARQARALGGARAREHQALVEALLTDAGAGATDAAAAAARWPLPATLQVAVLLGSARRLDAPEVLLGHVEGTALAIVAERDAAALLEAGVALALGPAVAPDGAAISLARARRVAALVAGGVLPVGRALCWEDHLADLIVHADAAAAEALTARRLAPLEALPPARARMLRETLAGWLDHPGRPRRIAEDLHLHHQTVRYRLARLREAFGDQLDDPHARFELALALRADRFGLPGAP
jgi:hypothetical protein